MKYAFVLLVYLLASVELCAKTPTNSDLKQIEQQLQQEREKQKQTTQQSHKISAEIDEVKTKMIQSARSILAGQESLKKLQDEEDALNEKSETLTKNVQKTTAQSVQMATTLQNLALRPAELMILDKNDAVNAFRGKIILNTTIPIIRALNQQTLDELGQLVQNKDDLSLKQAELKRTVANLNKQKAQMDSLMQEKTALQKKYTQESATAVKNIKQLASKARDVKDLLAKLEKQKKQASSNPSFTNSKGRLPLPVMGRVIERFDEVGKTGIHAKGITIQAYSGAMVVAPNKGVAMFSGPFKNYGQLLIIDNGNDYLTLLAGMEEINVSAGDTILKGEPLGRMKYGSPNLYLELRKNGQPINPFIWFAQ